MHARDVVEWSGRTIAYRYREGRGKRLAITVYPDLTVEVRAPGGTTLERIREKVIKRGEWILRAQRRFEKFLPTQPARQYVPGETHRYLGRQYRLRWAPGRNETVMLRRGVLEVGAPALPSPARIEALVVRWYRDRAAQIFDERLAACLTHPAFHSLDAPRLTVRTMRRRWGSCTRGGRLVLNAMLVQAPRDCIDYVISHELCHLLRSDHSPRFWRLLQRVCPEWRSRRDELARLIELPT